MLTGLVAAYMLTRMWSTMDHITNGRIGWNVVTSYSTPAAKAFGHDAVVPHDERYAAAEEYMELCYRFVFPSPPRLHLTTPLLNSFPDYGNNPGRTALKNGKPNPRWHMIRLKCIG